MATVAQIDKMTLPTIGFLARAVGWFRQQESPVAGSFRMNARPSAAASRPVVSILRSSTGAATADVSPPTGIGCGKWLCRSVTLFGELPPNRTLTLTLTYGGASELAQLMQGTTAGALIPENRAPELPGSAGSRGLRCHWTHAP